MTFDIYPSKYTCKETNHDTNWEAYSLWTLSAGRNAF